MGGRLRASGSILRKAGFTSRKVKILEHAETIGDRPTRSERPWQHVTRQFWARVTLCYVRFGWFPGQRVQLATMIVFKQIEFFGQKSSTQSTVRPVLSYSR